jgi:hypothetical protein
MSIKIGKEVMQKREAIVEEEEYSYDSDFD